MRHVKEFALALMSVLVTATIARAEVAIVLNSGEDTVSLIDTGSYREITRYPIGKEPHHLMATPDDRYLVVANAVSNELVFLDPRTGGIRQRVTRISDPYQIGFSPNQQWFVANSLRLNRVDLYRHDDRAFTLAARLSLGRAPSHLAFTPDSQTVFVTLQDDNRIGAVSLADHTTRWIQPTGKQPAGVWVTLDARHLLVGITGEDVVEVRAVATGALVKKLRTGKGAHNFLAVGDGRHVLVTNRVADTISVIDQAALEVVDTFRRARRTGLHGAHPRRPAALGDVSVDQPRDRDRHGDSEGRAVDSCRPLAPRNLFPQPCTSPVASPFCSPPSPPPPRRRPTARAPSTSPWTRAAWRRPRRSHGCSRPSRCARPSSSRTRRPCMATARSTPPGPATGKARVAEGHAFGNHTWSHHYVRRDEGERIAATSVDGRARHHGPRRVLRGARASGRGLASPYRAAARADVASPRREDDAAEHPLGGRMRVPDPRRLDGGGLCRRRPSEQHATRTPRC